MISVKMKSEELTETLVETEAYSIHLFDRETLRIETEDGDTFLNLLDAKIAASDAQRINHTARTELDRKIITRIWREKSARYATLAKQLRGNRHNGDYLNTFSKNNELGPRETLEQFDELIDQAIQELERYVENCGWPEDLKR